MVTTSGVEDEPCTGLFPVTDAADDVDVPGVFDVTLLMDVELFLALEPPVVPVGVGIEVELLLTGYGALDVGP